MTPSPNSAPVVLDAPAAKATTHGNDTRRRGSQDWSAGAWKHPARPARAAKSWPLTLTFLGLTIFVAILTAVSIGFTLSRPF